MMLILRAILVGAACSLSLCSIASAADLVETLKASVVKIISRADGVTQIGTGFVVGMTGDRIVILTAAHVVHGDPAPQIEFYAARGSMVAADSVKLEGDEADSLAILRVARSKVAAVPAALPFSPERVTETSSVLMIGFPRGGGEWNVVTTTVSGRKGRALTLSAPAQSGNSGGPVLQGGAVVGVVTESSEFALATPALTVVDLLQTWGAPVATRAPAKDPEPSDRAGGFRVIEALVRAEPVEFKGRCPASTTVVARISVVGGAGLVSYRFLRSDGVSTPIQTLSFDGPGTKEVRSQWSLGTTGASMSGWQQIRIFDPAEMLSERAAFRLQCDAAAAGPPAGTCIQGYVWREALAGDTVCVLPSVRSQAAYDNSQAAARRQPGGGPYGPDTCRVGYVWREVQPADHVCVKPETRDQVHKDNALGPARVVR